MNCLYGLCTCPIPKVFLELLISLVIVTKNGDESISSLLSKTYTNDKPQQM